MRCGSPKQSRSTICRRLTMIFTRLHRAPAAEDRRSYIRAYITRVEMGGIFGTIVLLVDVTYNVKAEKMRQEFTANVSHELKTR